MARVIILTPEKTGARRRAGKIIPNREPAAHHMIKFLKGRPTHCRIDHAAVRWNLAPN